MTPKTQRTKECAPAERAGRLQQAEGFWADAEDLAALVGMKTLAGYGAAPVSASRVTTARTAAEKLLTAARRA